MAIQIMVIIVFYLTQAEGLITGTMVKMFTSALSGDRQRDGSERGVWAGAGAGGESGIICFGGGGESRLPQKELEKSVTFDAY